VVEYQNNETKQSGEDITNMDKTSKADLHVHSKYSERPSEWVLRKIGCAESYTEPAKLYKIAMEKGMDFITITDHNTLNGALEIAHLPNAFISEEVTTYFPDDRCKLHVLVFDINEAQHQDITHLRENVFDLVAYLNREKIVHALAHPLFAINDRLTNRHAEQSILLFKTFEINGARDQFLNNILKEIIQNLTPERIDQLAEKYDIQPYGKEPWIKHLTAGSDDHSSLTIASSYTEMDHVESIDEFIAGIKDNKTRVCSQASSPRTLAHNLYSIAYQFYGKKFQLHRYVGKELMLRFAHHALTLDHEDENGFVDRVRNIIGYTRGSHLFRSKPKTMVDILQKEAREIICHDPEMVGLMKRQNIDSRSMERAWFRFVNQISGKILRQFADAIMESLSGANVFDIFHSIGSAGALYTMLSPYFVAYTVFTKDRQFCRSYRDRFFEKETPSNPKKLKVAHFTDTFYDVNGVALTLQMQIKTARKNKKQQTIITCGPESHTPQVVNFEPIGTFAMPEYPEMRLYYPPLLQMLDYCYQQHFTHIHAATPGPIGLAALAIAQILKLPIYGTYHTALPQYVNQLTNDNAMGDIMWKYSMWYYNQMDAVYVPSRSTGEELASKGIPKAKIRFYPRGIDIQRFHPSKRNGFFRDRFHITGDAVKLLYVGRVSREKNLPHLVDIYRKLIDMEPGFHLVIVGNGPYLTEMQNALEGLPVTFAGFLEGEDLAQAYASSDIFIFPSTTDTFGNVVLEAQASGLPVIVTDQGGPKENMVHEETGFVVPAGRPDAFIEALQTLIQNPSLCYEMKNNARKYVEDRSFEAAYMSLWDSYRTPGMRCESEEKAANA
jgi:glycosyltransferase involved in cell wall biosynthesis/predicted metal-dependent phosphoesterase TrpH